MSDTPLVPAVDLVRMSTDRQANSPERQRLLFAEYCQRYHLQPVGEYADLGVSGSRVSMWERPAVKALLSDAAKGRFRIVFCEEVSRATRKAVDAVLLEARLRELNVLLVSNADNPHDRIDAHLRALLTYVRGWQAEGETLIKNRRVAEARRELAMRGVYTGGYQPLGLRWDKRHSRWVVDAAGARVVRDVFARYAATGSSTETARQLNREGVPAPRGGGWYQSTVVRMVTNSAYRGRQRWRGEEYPVNLPQVVDAALVARVDELLALKSGRPQRSVGTVTARALFAGLLRCPECGCWLNTSLDRPDRRHEGYINYRCPRAYLEPRTCDWRHYVAQLSLEAVVVPAVVEHLQGHRPQPVRRDRGGTRRAARRQGLTEERDRVTLLFARGRISEERMETLLGDVQRREEQLAQEEQQQSAAPPELTARESTRYLRALTEYWPLLSVPERRELLQTLLESVTVSPPHYADALLAWRSIV